MAERERGDDWDASMNAADGMTPSFEKDLGDNMHRVVVMPRAATSGRQAPPDRQEKFLAVSFSAACRLVIQPLLQTGYSRFCVELARIGVDQR